MYYLKMFGISLGLTLLFELGLALLLGIRKKEDLIIVLLVNILTNPLAVYLCYLARIFLRDWYLAAELLTELLVFLTEGFIYSRFKTEGKRIRNGFLLSLVLNGTSYSAGLIISLLK